MSRQRRPARATSGDLVEHMSDIGLTAWRRAGHRSGRDACEAALERGIDTFTATFLADNDPVTPLVRLVGPDVRRYREGIAEFSSALSREKVEQALRALPHDDGSTA
jgi:hypothetical protein